MAAIETWGLEKALIECVGMFAICVWDCHTRQLHLARDRMGEKPLYYGVSQDVFLFGSELKALWRHPQWRGVIDHNAVSHFLRFKYVPSPRTVFQGIFKLLPGTYLTLDIGKSGSLHGGL
ncbi:MAG: asparagine synthetase B, partial [Burkholderiales bacterium]|nr:asparagine synthetase B [Burkholderiales bacterium]